MEIAGTPAVTATPTGCMSVAVKAPAGKQSAQPARERGRLRARLKPSAPAPMKETGQLWAWAVPWKLPPPVESAGTLPGN